MWTLQQTRLIQAICVISSRQSVSFVCLLCVYVCVWVTWAFHIQCLNFNLWLLSVLLITAVLVQAHMHTEGEQKRCVIYACMQILRSTLLSNHKCAHIHKCQILHLWCGSAISVHHEPLLPLHGLHSNAIATPLWPIQPLAEPLTWTRPSQTSPSTITD